MYSGTYTKKIVKRTQRSKKQVNINGEGFFGDNEKNEPRPQAC